MVTNKHELDEALQKKLSLIEATPTRDPNKAVQGRLAYMEQVGKLTAHRNPAASPKSSILEYLRNVYGLRLKAAPVMIALVMTFALLLGGAWGTVYAAQDSLPGDFLYSVKLADENFRLILAGDPETKIDLLTSYTDRRVGEAVDLVNQGEPVPSNLPDEVESQYNAIFALASSMDDSAMSQALSGVQIHIRDQDRIMGQTMGGLPEGVDPQILRLRALVQAQHHRAATGTDNPNEFRNEFQNQSRYQANKPTVTPTGWITSTITPTLTVTVTATPVITNTWPYGPGPCETPGDCIPPGDGPGPGPFDGTPIPPMDQQGYGPGSDEGVGPQQPTVTPKTSKSSNKGENKSKP